MSTPRVALRDALNTIGVNGDALADAIKRHILRARLDSSAGGGVSLNRRDLEGWLKVRAIAARTARVVSHFNAPKENR